jgi:indolepyruvate ferredoxin oxidoreductase
MARHDVSLADRYDLTKSPVLLNGTQALVRLMLMQKARDAAAGWHTAGYVTGYRGSPLGAVDSVMARAARVLTENDIVFQPGLNEDLAVAAAWGTQQAHLRGQGTHEGVFALWYGKGPGVDRSGDAMRHANFAGTAPKGGVIMAMGDDHTGESSTTLHQSDWAMVDAYMPVVSPAGVQEILDYGLYGWALSRFAGVWVGLKGMKDTVEATAVVDGDPFRMAFATPDFAMPPGGLSIRLHDTPVAQEARMIDHKRHAAEAFARANGIDRRIWGAPGATIGLVAAGKNWLDLVHALSLLGIDAAEAGRLGITTYKVGQVWPLDMAGFRAWAEGLSLIVCVEEKRKLIEVQAKEAIFHDRRGRRVFGGTDDRGAELFTARYALDPALVAEKIGAILLAEGRDSDALRAGLARLAAARAADTGKDHAARLPYFCAGCPHNTSTKLPEGSRAYAGIGCHYMVQWMDRDTLGFTHMGGEGANWIGEAPFSRETHVFQNIGDGTYNHSGIQAIRAAVGAGTTITYKILFNDAVAMTGGQGNDGGLTAHRVAAEMMAVGAKKVVVVQDDKEDLSAARFPPGVEVHPRDRLIDVQEQLKAIPGVTVLLYVQTCAAEKRRRRKRGAFPDPDRRVFINTDVCEGCGDCGVQSNCVALVPVETELGRKRAIDQSSCNKDFSCLNGFCPSFVTLDGARPKKAATAAVDLPDLPLPALPRIDGTWNLLVTGVGGTGVVTVGAILAMAAHLDGKGAAMIEMTGMAQKGGAVHIHCRIAERPADISAIRVALGEADAVIGGDLVVTAGARTTALMARGRTGAVVNSHEIITGEFTRNTDFRIPGSRLRDELQRAVEDRLTLFDASGLARVTLGDSIYSNMMVFGAAWQGGLVPLTLQAIERAIVLNGAGVEQNTRAFALGRWAALHPDRAAALLQPATPAAIDPVQFRADHLRAYQDDALALRYLALVDRAPAPLREAVARGYHKLLSYKDEYEVARLHLTTLDKARAEFDGALRPRFWLAPPLLPGQDAAGRPKKRAFGPWMIPVFRLLARLKPLRGTAWDPFGRTVERRMERALIAEYESDMAEWLPKATPATLPLLRDLAELPLAIRGFGPVKAASAAQAAARRRAILAQLAEPPAAAAIAAA